MTPMEAKQRKIISKKNGGKRNKRLNKWKKKYRRTKIETLWKRKENGTDRHEKKKTENRNILGKKKKWLERRKMECKMFEDKM